ncbi:MAG TPA: HIT family protein [Nitrosopumilaceae archaeon]|jgi:histidine triad (HIT) family protein|nr:HIT family protein [Nitrosopumilaceae archaeon]
MDCIFCNIVEGKIPARKIMETEKSLAFLDVFPLTKGHTLVIPKNHYSKIQEMSNDDNIDLFESVRVLTNKIELLFSSSLIAIHNGKESGQEVPHVHVHIIPRTIDDGAGSVHSMFRKRPHFTNDELDQIAEKLNKKIES